jgi:hypothetical protein
VEEDVVSWEDMSQASVSSSRRRSRRNMRRADDDATLAAIREVSNPLYRILRRH